MNKTILLLSACALVSGAAQAQTATAPTAPVSTAPAASAMATPVTAAATTAMLPAGTLIAFRMDKALATDQREFAKGEVKPPKDKRRVSNKGDAFTMSVLNDVKVGDQLVIPAGTTATGEVTMVSGRGGFGKSGKIEIRMDRLDLGGRSYAMEGSHLQKGKGRGGAAIAGTILAGAIAGAFIKGDEADIPMGAELSFKTREPIPYTVAPVTIAPVATPVAAEPAAPTT